MRDYTKIKNHCDEELKLFLFSQDINIIEKFINNPQKETLKQPEIISDAVFCLKLL